MDVALLILSIVLLILGFVGSVLPMVPGPPLSWIALLLLHFSNYGSFSNTFLIVSFICMLAIAVLDYFIPIWGTKRFGGSRSGVIGATIGLIAGLFVLPFGIVLGPFVGALVGELLHQPEEFKKALRSATGSLVGFLIATWLKLMYGAWAISMLIMELW